MAQITLKTKDLWYDACANSWKTGRIQPREDGLHGETQISEDTLDQNIAKRLLYEGMNYLLEALKDFRAKVEATDALPADPNNIVLTGAASDTVSIALSKTNSRCNITNAEASALGHAYVLAHVLTGWYRLVSPDRVPQWESRKEDAKLRLLAALRYKTEPEDN